jgi:signal transduction histidine kinase/ActR/RegA family two-component response regulator
VPGSDPPSPGRGATKQLRGLLEAAPDAILVVDTDERIVHVNAQSERLFGYARAELQGQPFDRVLGTRPRGSLDVHGLRKDGTAFPVEVTLGHMEGETGTLVIAFVRDDTEKRTLAQEAHRATREAETANRLKDEFLATLSHELRSPLGAILGWAQILRAKSDPATLEKGIQVVERNALVAVKLVEDILDVSRIVSGKLSLKKGWTELNAVVQAAVEVVRPAADRNGIALEVRLSAEAGVVSADPDRLQQIVWNVLTNAVKFTPRGGRVELRSERLEGQVEIRVSDTGKGIRADLLPFIWDRFRQGDSSVTRAHGGLGLGLPLVRYLAEAHGGTVSAESPGEGRGAVFTIRLPVGTLQPSNSEEPSLPGVPASPSSVTSFALDGLRILVVDDDRDSRDVVSAVLRDRGADVRVAESAVTALDVLRVFEPDVLVSDIAMPDIDGYELLRRVRALPSARTLRAISLSAYAAAEDRANSAAAGFTTHLAKPVSIRDLVRTIETVATGLHRH